MTTDMVSTPMNVSEVFDALETWIKQRPGLDPANYGLDMASGRAAYRSEIRNIAKDRTRAMKALDEARGLTPAKPELLADAFRAFSGRLQWVQAVNRSACLYNPCTCHDDSAWSPGVYTNGCSCGCGWAGKLSYTTGQYWPTEYRKAAAAVLENYIAAWHQAYAAEHPQTFTYRTMDDVIAANRSIGNHWFDPSSMRFFKTRIESGAIACHDESGKPTRARFITSEKGPDEMRRYSIREAQPDGTIDTIGKFQEYRTRDQARANLLKERTA